MLPHADTVRYLAEHLDPGELNGVLESCHESLRRDKRLGECVFRGRHYMLAVDGTEFGSRRHPVAHSCHRRLASGETEYFQSALVASLVSRTGLRLPLAVEFIENNEGAGEWSKNDCELKAFARLADRLAARFPRTSFCLLLDGLYFCEPVLSRVRTLGWEAVVTWRPGVMPGFSKLAENRIRRSRGHRLGVEHGGFERYECSWCEPVEYRSAGAERAIRVTPVRAAGVFEHSGGETRTFQYVTTMEVKISNVEDIVETCRARWQIEEEFRAEKHSELALTSMFGTCGNASLNYFMVVQVACLIRTLVDNTNYFEKLARLQATGTTAGWREIRRRESHGSTRSMIRAVARCLVHVAIRLDGLPAGTYLLFEKFRGGWADSA